jgi:hypothetical protein
VLECAECGCVTDDGHGWVGVLVQDPDEDPHPAVATYCPPCAALELDGPADDGYR